MSWLEHSYCRVVAEPQSQFFCLLLNKFFPFPQMVSVGLPLTFKLHWPWMMHGDLLRAPESRLRCRCQIHCGLSVYLWYSSIGPQPLPHELLILVLWFISETKNQEVSILCEAVLWWQDPSAHSRHGLWANLGLEMESSEWESSWKEDTKWKCSHTQT